MDSRTEKMLAARPKGLVLVARNALAWAKMHKSEARAIAAATVVVLSVGYYYAIWRPAHERDQLALQALAAERLTTATSTRQVDIDICLAKTQTESENRWKAACKKRGERGGCALPGPITEALEREDASARNACLTR
jgi:type II secretory pathway component PulM